MKIKYSLGKESYWVKGSDALESRKSKTPTSSPSLPSPLNYETPIIESNKDTVRGPCLSLEEKVNLFNIEITAMKSFIEDQIFTLRQSRKDSTLQKSSCDHNSEITRLTHFSPVSHFYTYLRNESRTKSCTLLENANAAKTSCT